MRLRRRSSLSRSRVAQGVVLALVAGTLTVLAIAYDGSPIHDVELNDGGVWVTNGDRGLMGRLNSQIEQLDLAVATSGSAPALFQQGSAVQSFDDGGSPDAVAQTLTVVDVVTGEPTVLPLAGHFRAAAAGSTVALLAADTGKVWVRRSDQLAGFDGTPPPDLVVSPRSTVTVTQAGTALVADRAKGVVTALRFDETGAAHATRTWDFTTGFTDDAVLSAVGEEPVLLQEGRLYRPDEDAVDVPGEGAQLQQVGPADPDVYVATSTGLYRGSMGGGGLKEISGLAVDGPPAAPVVDGGCVHGAWNDPGTDDYARVCGDHDVVTGAISQLSSTSQLVFRVNRDVVVLNDTTDGTMWMVQEPGLTRVSDWESIAPTSDPQKAKADPDQHKSQTNQPPKAVDDDFGARPGATVVLPVTLNDIDADGDILVIDGPPGNVGHTTFALVGDDTEIQAHVAKDASGVLKFRYKISDGQPGHIHPAAEVRLKIAAGSADTAPAPISCGQSDCLEPSLRVARGYQASLNVLAPYIDPEGDAVTLVDARTDRGKVGFRPDGTIDYTDDGSAGTSAGVEFTLQGGTARRTFHLPVEVVDPAQAVPTTVADHVTGPVGARILLQPLRNDIDPLGGDLGLASIQRESGHGGEVTSDGRGNASFRADQPGTYYLSYVANGSNGVGADPQTIRVDAVATSGPNRPPVAMRDIAAVRPGATTLVDVLANDTDPDGDVLVVQGATTADPKDADRVKVSLVNKRFVRVETRGQLGGDVQVDYLLSDGRSDQVRGTVTVTSASSVKNRPPVPVEDDVTARAGTVITVPVLDNDADPDGDRMTVDQGDLFDLGRSHVIADHQVPVIATGNEIRVLVPDDGTTQLQIGYGVRDPEHARGDSRLVLNIKPDDRRDDQKPQPRPIEDRTVTGQRIRVPVSSFGSDPDGDPVVFDGVVQPPQLGRIVGTGADWFDYEPLTGDRRTGTDSFKIQVADQYGLTGVADVRIGVAPPADTNQPPSAMDDDLLVKPGLTVQVPVLNNDSDPDGDPLLLSADDISASHGAEARLVGSSIQVTAPDVSGDHSASVAVQYVVSDGLGGSATGVLTVTSSRTAPDYAPTAQDDVVTPDQLRGKSVGDTVDVDVLKNDGDVDGALADLRIAPVDGHQAGVVDRKVRVTLRRESQVVPYRITDGTDQTSFGFIYVTGLAQMPPVLDTTQVPVEVKAGKAQTIQLSDVVVVRSGHQPHLGDMSQSEQVQGDARRKGDGAVEWLSPEDYWGPASVTLPVLDEKTYNTPGMLQSQITIPITVLPAHNVAPTTRDTAITLYAGGDPVALRLDRLATDPNPGDDLTYDVGATPPGVDASVGSDELTFQAGADAASTQRTVVVQVSDGDADPVPAQVTVTVIGGKDADALKAPMTLRDLSVPDAHEGRAVTIDVRDAILFDPFPSEDKAVISVQGDGITGNPTSSGTSITVTPKGDGQGTLTYGLDDGSGDPNRVVQGRIRVTVAGKPDAPGTPRGVEGGPDSVQLTWSAPDSNGSDITGYRVEGSPSGSASCAATQCTVTGLKAGTSYKFHVRATNGEGDSPWSSWSIAVKPDEAPMKMAAPQIVSTTTARDGQLEVRWTAPENHGSKILHYVLRGDGNAPAIPNPPAGATSTVVHGLTNGTTYRFQIWAVNDRGEGVPSDWSAADHPYTVPAPMSAPTITGDGNNDGRSGGFITYAWTPPSSDGGDPVSGYDIELRKDGVASATQHLSGDARAATFNVDNGHAYTAVVRAGNAAGDQQTWSSPSDSRVAYDPSGPVTGIVDQSDCPNGACSASTTSYVGQVGFTTPADNGGYDVVKYKWSTQDGASGEVPAPTSASGVATSINVQFRTATAGQAVTLVPVTNVDTVGETDGQSSGPGGSFNPYALPLPPTVTAQSGGYRSAHAAFGCSSGNGRAVDSHDYPRRDSGGTETQACVLDWTSIEGGTTKCASARVHNAAGWSATSSLACGTADPRHVTPYFSSTPATNACKSPCYHIEFRVDGFNPGSYSGHVNASGSPYSVCNGNFNGSSEPISVGSDGRGDHSTSSWFISGTCTHSTKVTVTVDAVPGSSYVP